MSTDTKLAPTVEAIDAWRAQEKKQPDGSHCYWIDGPSYGVNVWTKAGRARCITHRRVDAEGRVWYETIRGEGSSNGCRVYEIEASQIVRAEGWIV